MTRRKYPLEPLARVREGRTNDQAAVLAQAVRDREASQRAREQAEAIRRAAQAQVEVVRGVERVALEQGKLSVADLARADAWALRARAEDAALERQVHQRAGAEAVACAAEQAERADLASRRAELDVVEKDRARWAADQHRADLAREEEAAEEAWRPR